MLGGGGVGQVFVSSHGSPEGVGLGQVFVISHVTSELGVGVGQVFVISHIIFLPLGMHP